MMKIMVLVLAVMMVLGVATAFVEGSTTRTTANLTINDSRSNRTYVAYQIITGDVTGTEDSPTSPLVLSNIKWGNGVSGKTSGTALTSDEVEGLPGSTATRTEIETYLASLGTLQNPSAAATSVTGGYQFTGLTAGWYVVKETTEVAGEDDFTSAFIVEVVGNATATPKGSKTTSEKKVNDITTHR